MHYILYFLMFLFGYATCRTFYFWRASRISLSLIKLGHLIYLSAIRQIIADWDGNLAQQELPRNDRIFQQQELEERIEFLKLRSMDYLLKMHPPFYREALNFTNWDTAMNYIDESNDIITQFWEGKKL